MMRAATVVAVVALLIVGVPGLGQAQLPLVAYDNFDDEHDERDERDERIDPSKWQGSEGGFGPLAPNVETTRRIVDGRLRLSLVSWGRTDSDTGTAGVASTRLGVTNPAPITTLEAAVIVKRAIVDGCAANTTVTRARAQVIGGFFNDGTSPASGNRIGDVLAGIQKVRDSSLGDRIEAFVNRCTNAACTTFTTLALHVFTTVWRKGRADTLRVQWDPANNQFHYAVNPGNPLEEAFTLGYTLQDALSPVVNFKQLAVANSVASCTAVRGSAAMTAEFDNVKVNP